ncbi:hypothetical protein PtrSN002B_002687 [Pyrenophora tritici-repentis]|nr:hypothetical protein A1F99_102280 [Pyrenophora tritici-repentis]KAI0584667.1 hypothetical protein Alg215_02904 [Pyrenophora tritici-repentis]KAI0590059.1 hypothetical protein Alg130_02614 [Pyrenophora tritici-repentis]KAI0613114.1 hypothetical protein TUN205_02607 [Pyrenophora tritici-repentis]KAI0625186.1 hypothetical protein TUN199_02783 [Pyrenophora tritici-repentis]
MKAANLTGETVQVLVGNNILNVHATTLIQTSNYLQDVLRTKQQTKSNELIHLPT